MTPIPKLDRGKESHHGPYATPLARIPRVDETECVGCNLCSLVCPVEDCITMEQVDLGLPKQSWAERVAHATNSIEMATVTNDGGDR
jgi:dihydropyrimidine dehydrogenase (NAD+) subunit PreA